MIIYILCITGTILMLISRVHFFLKLAVVLLALVAMALQFFVFSDFRKEVNQEEIMGIYYNDITKGYTAIKGSKEGDELKAIIQKCLEDGKITNEEYESQIKPKLGTYSIKRSEARDSLYSAL